MITWEIWSHTARQGIFFTSLPKIPTLTEIQYRDLGHLGSQAQESFCTCLSKIIAYRSHGEQFLRNWISDLCLVHVVVKIRFKGGPKKRSKSDQKEDPKVVPKRNPKGDPKEDPKKESKKRGTFWYRATWIIFFWHKKHVSARLWAKIRDLKCYLNPKKKPVYLRGPHSLRLCISRPCCNDFVLM